MGIRTKVSLPISVAEQIFPDGRSTFLDFLKGLKKKKAELLACSPQSIRLVSFEDNREQPFKSEKRSRKVCLEQQVLTIQSFCLFCFILFRCNREGLFWFSFACLYILLESSSWAGGNGELWLLLALVVVSRKGGSWRRDGAYSRRKECIWERLDAPLHPPYSAAC